jgi:hypothetical protein
LRTAQRALLQREHFRPDDCPYRALECQKCPVVFRIGAREVERADSRQVERALATAKRDASAAISPPMDCPRRAAGPLARCETVELLLSHVRDPPRNPPRN